MKRVALFAIILQIVLTPFCGVFAMSNQSMTADDACATSVHVAPDDMDSAHTTQPSIRYDGGTQLQTPVAACCQSNPVSTQRIQFSNIEFRVPAICPHLRYRTPPQNNQPKNEPRSNTHPPDDFERLSQAKRE